MSNTFMNSMSLETDLLDNMEKNKLFRSSIDIQGEPVQSGPLYEDYFNHNIHNGYNSDLAFTPNNCVIKENFDLNENAVYYHNNLNDPNCYFMTNEANTNVSISPYDGRAVNYNQVALPNLKLNSSQVSSNLADSNFKLITNKINTSVVKKQKRVRTAFTTEQIMKLESEFIKTKYLDRSRRIELSNLLNLNERTLKVWFQNRRMKEKKDRMEELEDSEATSTSEPLVPLNSTYHFSYDWQAETFVPKSQYSLEINPVKSTFPINVVDTMDNVNLPVWEGISSFNKHDMTVQQQFIGQADIIRNDIYNDVHFEEVGDKSLTENMQTPSKYITDEDLDLSLELIKDLSN